MVGVWPPPTGPKVNPRRTVGFIDDQTYQEWLDYSTDPKKLGEIQPTPEAVNTFMLNQPVGDDGRSEWFWLRLVDGTLVWGCFPTGDAYFKHEEMRVV